MQVAHRSWRVVLAGAKKISCRTQDHSLSIEEDVSLVQIGPVPSKPEFVHVVSQHAQVYKVDRGTLMDRGANGGILGGDARVFHKYQ